MARRLFRTPVPGPVLICAVLTLVAIVVTACRHRADSRAYLRHFAPDIARVKAVCRAVAGVYEYEGRLLTSLDELQRTAFYPFAQPYGASCLGGRLSLRVEPSGAALECMGIHRIGGQTRTHTRLQMGHLTREDATRRRIAAFTAGVLQRTRAIEDIKSAFLETHRYAMRIGDTPCRMRFDVRPTVRPPIAHDMPANPAELDRYLEWLAQTEGVRRLDDAWGRPLTFRIESGVLRCVSRGSDGVAGTADDVVRLVRVAGRGAR